MKCAIKYAILHFIVSSLFVYCATALNTNADREVIISGKNRRSATSTMDVNVARNLQGSNQVFSVYKEHIQDLDGSNNAITVTDSRIENLQGSNNVITVTNSRIDNLEGSNNEITVNKGWIQTLKGYNNIVTVKKGSIENVQGSNNEFKVDDVSNVKNLQGYNNVVTLNPEEEQPVNTTEIIKTNLCEPNPCQNGGACSVNETAFICRCPGTFTGTTCDTRPAVITVPPRNTSKLEGGKVEFICEAKALPANITHRWYHNGIDITQLSWLESRSLIRKDGLLLINPLTAEDSGMYTCEVSNGIGNPDSSSAYLNVEYPARVTYSPTIQYLPSGLSGVLRCYVQANPPVQFITWTKDRRPFDPNANPGVITLNNGSLLFQRVSHEDQGIYRCTPYNLHATAGTSNGMEVLVRDFCEPNPCKNGGACSLTRANFKCRCPGTFTGRKCETNYCEPNPCQNGGACSFSGADFKCRCPGTFTGKTCDAESV